MKGLFISGSGTNVGKTFIAIRIIQALNANNRIVVRKPIESDCVKTAAGLLPKDAVLLSNACQHPEPLERVCHYRFAACVSGEKASTDKGVNITLRHLVQASEPSHHDDFVLVEGAGGLYSPMAVKILNSDLVRVLKLPLVIVVKDELGAINQALLSLEAAKLHKLKVKMLVLNQIHPNDLDNAKALRAYTHIPVVVFNKAHTQDFAFEINRLIQQR